MTIIVIVKIDIRFSYMPFVVKVNNVLSLSYMAIIAMVRIDIWFSYMPVIGKVKSKVLQL